MKELSSGKINNFEHANIITRIIFFSKKREYRATLFHYLQSEIVIYSHQIFFISQTIYRQELQAPSPLKHQNMNVQCEYYFKVSYPGSKSNMEHVKTNVLVRPYLFRTGRCDELNHIYYHTV